MIDLEQTLAQLTALPIPDRLRIMESLWDSIPADAELAMPQAQREELDRRIAAHRRNPEDLLTWDQVLDGLREHE